MPATTAQAHLAIAVLQNTVAGAAATIDNLRFAAADVLFTSLREEKWTGAVDDCAPFGMVSEEAGAEIDKLRQAVVYAQASVAVLVTFAEKCRKEALSIQELRTAAALALSDADHAAQGIPPKRE